MTLDADGTVKACDTGKIVSIDEDAAEEYATEVYGSGKTKGFSGIYRYLVTDTEDGTMIIFVDCRQEISTVKNFAKNSFGISTIGLAAVFVLVVFFSKLVFRPVAESYKKQKQFITDASHELKTPLTIIDANTEILEMDHGESQWTKSIHNQVLRLTSMTQQLINLSKLDEARNSEKGGSGIGLSVAKAVVSAHKGKISAFSEDGHSMLIKVVW
ncbi:sensor histidine kinase [Eubacterium ramulus]